MTDKRTGIEELVHSLVIAHRGAMQAFHGDTKEEEFVKRHAEMERAEQALLAHVAGLEERGEGAVELLEWVMSSTGHNVPAGTASRVREFFRKRGEPHWIGKEVRVLAWWTKPERVIRCRVLCLPLRVWSERTRRTPNYTVEPLVGLKHGRSVEEARVEDCRGWKEPAPRSALAGEDGGRDV